MRNLIITLITFFLINNVTASEVELEPQKSPLCKKNELINKFLTLSDNVSFENFKEKLTVPELSRLNNLSVNLKSYVLNLCYGLQIQDLIKKDKESYCKWKRN